MTDLVLAPSAQLAPRTPEDVKAWMAHVQEMRKSVLVNGTDYMVIPGTPKPTLLQPGAEKMLLLAGMGFTMKHEIMDANPIRVGSMEHPEHDGAYYTCTVVKGDQVVAQCEGYAGYDEDRFVSKNGKRQPWNSVIKMAQKRAKVGAISAALALSGLFTQDLEDEPERTNPIGLIQPYLDQLDDEGLEELRKWRNEANLPAPSAMTLEQAAGVLVHIGLIAGSRMRPFEEVTPDAPANPPLPATS